VRQEQGLYKIVFYDEIGSKVATDSTMEGYLTAITIGKDWLNKTNNHSFVISRVLYNSAIRNNKHEYKLTT